jgi:hypothetical protein
MVVVNIAVLIISNSKTFFITCAISHIFITLIANYRQDLFGGKGERYTLFELLKKNVFFILAFIYIIIQIF